MYFSWKYTANKVQWGVTAHLSVLIKFMRFGKNEIYACSKKRHLPFPKSLRTRERVGFAFTFDTWFFMSSLILNMFLHFESDPMEKGLSFWDHYNKVYHHSSDALHKASWRDVYLSERKNSRFWKKWKRGQIVIPSFNSKILNFHLYQTNNHMLEKGSG